MNERNLLDSLNYPFESSVILRKKKLIRKELLLRSPAQPLKIAILGGSTTAELRNILELFLLKGGFLPEFYESEYNKYFEDAVFPNEELRAFGPDIIYVHTSTVNITRFPGMHFSESQTEELADEQVGKFTAIWDSLQQYNCAIIQNNFDLPVNRALGNLDAYDHRGKTYFTGLLNARFAQYARKVSNLYLNDIHYLSADLGLRTWFDKSIWHSAKYAQSFDAIPVMANSIASIIFAILGRSKKCLVLDLDNTCWGGVIGDDGLDGIQLGNETAAGESYMSFQSFSKELLQRGILLAVSSKNETDIARSGFTHKDTVLKLDDFTAFRANWEPKSENIRAIASEINIGIDSLVFIDDNPAEREIVSAQLPQVAVPDVGSDVLRFADYIDRQGFFEPVSLSEDDLKRNSFYTGNAERVAGQAQFSNYEDFLRSLEMRAEIRPFGPTELERITQLINKTNQFNVTTRRYTFGEVSAIAADPGFIPLYGRLSDKFGDNGIICISIGRLDGKTVHIDLFLMSCRVLKRDMEYAMLDEIVRKSRALGATTIRGYYNRTPKNSMVSDLFDKFEFRMISGDENSSIWELDLNAYTDKNSLISIENDQSGSI